MKWIVKERAQQCGIGTAYRLALIAGLPYSSTKGIWEGTAKRVDLDTLQKLTRALHADISDLIAPCSNTTGVAG